MHRIILIGVIGVLIVNRVCAISAEPDSESIPTKVNAVYGITTRSADSEDISTTANVVYGIKGDSMHCVVHDVN